MGSKGNSKGCMRPQEIVTAHLDGQAGFRRAMQGIDFEGSGAESRRDADDESWESAYSPAGSEHAARGSTSSVGSEDPYMSDDFGMLVDVEDPGFNDDEVAEGARSPAVRSTLQFTGEAAQQEIARLRQELVNAHRTIADLSNQLENSNSRWAGTGAHNNTACAPCNANDDCPRCFFPLERGTCSNCGLGRQSSFSVSSNSGDDDSASRNDSANNNDHEISNNVIGNAPNVWAGIILDKVDSYFWSSPDDWLLKACVADDAQNKGLMYTMGRWSEDKLVKALDSDKASVRKIAAKTLLMTKTVLSKDTRDRVLEYFSEDGQDGDFSFSLDYLEEAFKMCTQNDLSFEERHEALTNLWWTLRGLADREEIRSPMDREQYADDEDVIDREMYDKAGSQEFLADDLPGYMSRVEACLMLLANDGVSLSGRLLAWSQGADCP